MQIAERPEPRQTLVAQYQNNKDIKTVSMIQDLCKTRKDNAPKSTEIDLFWELMDSWEILEKRLVVTQNQMKNDWTETLSDWRDEKFIKQMLAYHSTYNGITNCLHHMIGCMVKHVVGKNKKVNDDDSALTKSWKILSKSINTENMKTSWRSVAVTYAKVFSRSTIVMKGNLRNFTISESIVLFKLMWPFMHVVTFTSKYKVL